MNNSLNLSRPAPEDVGVVAWVRKHPLITFFVLAYVLTWGPTFLFSLPFVFPGPLLAALMVITVTKGRAGLRELGSRMIRWRVGWRWYVAALAIPLTDAVVASVLNVALGAPAPTLAKLPPLTSFFFMFALKLLDPRTGPMAEEPGWRGYALPLLQSTGRSPLLSTLLLALLVAGWHVPFVFVGLFPLVGILGAFAATFWYSWLFNRTNGSALMTLVMHCADGIFSPLAWAMFVSGAAQERWFLLHVGMTCLLAVGLVVLDWQAWQGDTAPQTGMVE